VKQLAQLDSTCLENESSMYLHFGPSTTAYIVTHPG